MNHYRQTSGYAMLYLVIVLSVTFLAALFGGLAGALGLSNVGSLVGGVVLATLFIAGFVIMQRFVAIENRRPTFSEANRIGLKSVLYFFAGLACIGAFIGFIILITKVFGLGGGGSGGAGRAAAEGADTANPMEQLIKPLWGLFALMFLLYFAPFLNLTVLSRLAASKISRTQ